MSAPVTTLADIITLAHNQYGIRFQLTTDQLVKFANTIQYIAFNQDLASFEEWGQIFLFGQEVFLETSGAYISPVESDIGKNVSGSTTGVIGKLKNFSTKNRINKWIIEPPDGGANFTLTDGETLSIVTGTGSGVNCAGQSYQVSNGPYRMPLASDGHPAFRKLIGVSNVKDKSLFHVPASNSFDGLDDYGVMLSTSPGRHQNTPFRLDRVQEHYEITLISSTAPQIEQTEEGCGAGGTTLNTSNWRWIYYRNPPAITSIQDETKLVIPEEYRYEILFKGVERLADTATYGEMGTVREMIEPLCSRFWEDMRTQFQQFGRGSDFVSHGDSWDLYGINATNGGDFNSRYGYLGDRYH